MTEECNKLTGRRRRICEGTEPIAPDLRLAYMERWAEKGIISSSLLNHGSEPGQEKPLPSLMTRGINIAKAGARAGAALITGNTVIAPAAVVTTRRNICNACPEKDQTNICRECGCFLAKKQQLLTENCPLGKWPRVL